MLPYSPEIFYFLINIVDKTKKNKLTFIIENK
jgi:hypothetical protein